MRLRLRPRSSGSFLESLFLFLWLQPLLSALGHMFPAFFFLGLTLIMVKVVNRPSVKGKIGEAAVNWGTLSRLDKARYAVLKNVFIPSISGKGTTELTSYIKSKQDSPLSQAQVLAAWETLSEHDAEMDKRGVRREHISRLSGRAHG